MAEMIAMIHPSIQGEVAHATQEAFDQVWVRKGWVIYEEPSEDLPPDVNPGAVKASKEDPENVSASADLEATPAVSDIKSSQGEVGING